MMKAYLAVTIDSELYHKIEQQRGREKRSTFVEHLLRLGMKEHRKTAEEENTTEGRKP
jgi:metal-responsive CopG/Arc/MetJ family transcriptional regulator